MIKFKPGERIRFTYKHHPEERDEDTGEPYKEILVLHQLWMKKVHGIDLRRLTPAEREVIDAIFDDKLAAEIKSGKQRHRFPLVNDIIGRMDPISEVKNPHSFYSKFVKVFLRDKDAYRTYYPHRMIAVSRIDDGRKSTRPVNTKPLFHKAEPQNVQKQVQTPPAQQQTAKSRLDLIRQRAQSKEKK